MNSAASFILGFEVGFVSATVALLALAGWLWRRAIKQYRETQKAAAESLAGILRAQTRTAPAPESVQ